eukprot:3738151-Prymnesium_polylepis.1
MYLTRRECMPNVERHLSSLRIGVTQSAPLGFWEWVRRETESGLGIGWGCCEQVCRQHRCDFTYHSQPSGQHHSQ